MPVLRAVAVLVGVVARLMAVRSTRQLARTAVRQLPHVRLRVRFLGRAMAGLALLVATVGLPLVLELAAGVEVAVVQVAGRQTLALMVAAAEMVECAHCPLPAQAALTSVY